MENDGASRRLERRFVLLTSLRWLPTGLGLPAMVLLQARGLDLPAIGAVVAVYGFTTLLLELPTGGLADVMGRGRVLVLAAALVAIAGAVIAFGTAVPVLVAAFVLMGVARSLDSGPLQAWYVDALHDAAPSAPIRRGLSRAGAAESVGLAGGALLSAVVVAVAPLPASGPGAIALSAPFLASSLMSLVHGAFVLAWVRDHPAPTRPRHGALAQVGATMRSGLALALSHPALRRVLAVVAAAGIAFAAIELIAPAQLASLLGGTTAAAAPYALLTVAGFAGSGAGSLLAPTLARLLRSPTRAVLVAAILAGGALTAVGSRSAPGMAAAFVTFYLLVGLCMPLVDELTHDAATAGERATVLSVSSMALQGSGIVASLGLGALAGASSALAALAGAGAILACGALAMTRWPGEPRPAGGR